MDLPTPSLSRSLQDFVLLGCALLALATGIWAATLGWNHNLLGQHGFRQTQTALTIDYLVRGGPWLAYETPLFGPPWRWPMEFPLYQWCVAFVVVATKIPIAQAARLVSLFFFYLCFVPIFAGLEMLGLSRTGRLPFLILLLSSPLYLFWSRSCMIESCAVCLGVWYLYGSGRYHHERKWPWLLLAAVMGTLLALVKVTTFPAFAFLGAVMFVAALLFEPPAPPSAPDSPANGAAQFAWPRSYRDWRARIGARTIVSAIALFVLPVVIGILWTSFSDSWKAQSPLTANLISSAPELRQWTLGTMRQRFSGSFLRMLVRTVRDTTGNPFLLVVFLPVLPLIRKRLLPAACCAVAFAIPPLIFTNVHIVHNYYPYANGLFLLGAAAFLIADLLEQGGRLMAVGLLLLVLSTLSGVIGYRSIFAWRQAIEDDTSLVKTGAVIRDTIAADQIVVLRGAAWSPVLVYYSGRRGILLERDHGIGEDSWTVVLGRVDRASLGVIGFCFDEKVDTAGIERLTRQLGFEPAPRYADENCSLFYPLSR